MTYTPPKLFIPTKEHAAATNTDQNRKITIAFREIERWVNGLSIPTGGGGGGLYASLTGPGETVTPGDLTQAGGFTINAGSAMGFQANVAAPTSGYGQGIHLNTTGFTSSNTANAAAIYLSSSNGIWLQETGTFGIALQSNAGLTLQGSPIRGSSPTGIGFYAGPSPPTGPMTGVFLSDSTGTGYTPGFAAGASLSSAWGRTNVSGLYTTVSSSDIPFTDPSLPGYPWPVVIQSGRGSDGSGHFANASKSALRIFTNQGPPNAYSPSTAGGILPSDATNTCSWCFDNYNGHIWVSRPTSPSTWGPWTMLV